MGCKKDRTRAWALRCMHEAQMHEHNCFITLTYEDEHLPEDLSVHYGEFQAFIKKLRRWTAIHYWQKEKKHEQWELTKIRFFMCGEYGEKGKRPHYHALIFNYNFPDRKEFKKKNDVIWYTSETLSSLWGKGFCTLGQVNYQTAAYVAQYCLKKIGQDESYYQLLDLETGEVYSRNREMVRMSLKPGIGATWYEKYKREVFPHDRIIVNGHKCKPPKYYTAKHKSADPLAYEDVLSRRYEKAIPHLKDNTEDRLLVKEKVLRAELARKTERTPDVNLNRHHNTSSIAGKSTMEVKQR